MNNLSNKFETLERCLYCESRDFSPLLSSPDWFSDREEVFFVARCNQCQLVFQQPRIKEEYISTYYGGHLDYFQVPIEQKKTFLDKVKAFLEKHTLINHFAYTHLGNKNIFLKMLLYPFKRWQKIKLVPTFVPHGSLFEVGCSHGANLSHMKSLGWNVAGQDLDVKSAEHAQSLGLSVSASRIEDVANPPESFDAVIMSMVLEHVYHPFRVLDQVSLWLRPNGQLIFSIPYFEGLEFNLFKEYSYSLHLPRHIVFLNKNIIIAYLKKLGYTDIKFYFQFFDRDMVTSAQYRHEAAGKWFDKLLSSNKFIRYFFIKPFLLFMSVFGKTGRVTVHARKR